MKMRLFFAIIFYLCTAGLYAQGQNYFAQQYNPSQTTVFYMIPSSGTYAPLTDAKIALFKHEFATSQIPKSELAGAVPAKMIYVIVVKTADPAEVADTKQLIEAKLPGYNVMPKTVHEVDEYRNMIGNEFRLNP